MCIRDRAKECGIDVCVNTKNKDFSAAMLEAFGPDKADVIYDCAGNNITMGQAIKYARKGSTIVLVAVFAGMAEVDLAVANDRELDIKSTMMYRLSLIHIWLDAVSELLKDKDIETNEQGRRLLEQYGYWGNKPLII